MEDFLEFCNAPEQYHIARELLIAGPIGEIPAILKKCRTEGERQRTKEYLFANIVAQPAGDITRFVRKFKKIIGSDYADEFYGAEQTAFSRLIPVMGEDPINMEKVRAIRENDSIAGEFERSMRKTETKLHESRLKNAPSTKSQSALSNLEQIHPAMLRKMSKDDRSDLRYALRTIISKCEGLIEECDRIG